MTSPIPKKLPGWSPRPSRRSGTIDILVNNAAQHDYSVGALEQRLETWQRILAINLSAPFQLAQSLLPAMVRKGSGRHRQHLVRGRTRGGRRRGCPIPRPTRPDWPHTPTRARVRPARDPGHAVCPGITRTPALEEGSKGQGGEALRSFIAGTAARRVAEPEEIGNIVLFLSSPEASFMDGAAVTVDGGYTIY